MADGFKANAAFFKLGFLDKNAVALGRQFKEMLPTLWMKAGAHGACPALGETVPEHEPDDMSALSEKLAAINLQLVERSAAKRKAIRWALIFICVLIAAVFAALAAMKSPYLLWDYSDPELAAAGTILHGFEFVFVRLAPIAFLAAVVGAVLTGRRKA